VSLGPVILDLQGTELTAEETELLRHPLVGGVILFTRNYVNLEQLQQLVAAIHAVRDPHLLVAVDHEGGRVQRFREGFTRLPAARRLGKLFDHNHHKAKELAQNVGWLMASELRSVGIDFSFAPVLDLDFGVCDVIGDRAFHSDPEAVYELTHAYIKGMAEAGMAAVGKHFPGHGAVTEDSHVAIPVDDRHFDQIYQQDIHPYRKLVRENLAAVMPAHVIYSQVDPKPAGFSHRWLHDILRQQLQFQGVIFSDDLNMHGASVAGDQFSERAAAAINAGCDIILVCNNRAGAIEILENYRYADNPVIHARIARMHGRHVLTRHALNASARWHLAVDQIQSLLDEPSLELKLS
jgi:beta-N-acetylhexosaminidase